LIDKKKLRSGTSVINNFCFDDKIFYFWALFYDFVYATQIYAFHSAGKIYARQRRNRKDEIYLLTFINANK
jgi:hypothetical protein